MKELGFNLSDIIELISLNFVILLFLYFVIFKYIKRKQSYEILNKISAFPVPILMIEQFSNALYRSNNCADIVFNLNNSSIGQGIAALNLFKDFNDYLNIKRNSKENLSTYDKISFNVGSDSIILDITYTLIIVNNIKYIVIALDDNSKLIKYIKYLGIFTSVIDKSSEGIIISKFVDIKSDPKIVYINDAINNITEFNSSDLLNTPLLENFFNKHISEDQYENIRSSIMHFKPMNTECEYTKKSGKKCWINVEIIAINKNDIENSLKKLNTNVAMKNTIELNLYNVDLYIIIKQTDISTHKDKEKASKIFFEQTQLIAEEKKKANEILTFGLMHILKNTTHPKKTDRPITKTLEYICKSLFAGKIYIVKFVDIENDSSNIEYIYKWSEKNIADVSNETFSKIMSTIDGYNMYSSFITNRPYYIYMNDIKSQEAKEFYKMTNIKSSMLCPIFKDKKLIGFIGVNEYNDVDRIWDCNAENILRITAENLGSIFPE